MSSFSHHVLLYLRTLYIVWSLVRRRVTRRLTRFQTMHNVLKNSKTLYNGCGAVAVNFQFTYVQYCIRLEGLNSDVQYCIRLEGLNSDSEILDLI